MALVICTWLWGDKYDLRYVERLAAGIHRHVAQPFVMTVFTPQKEDIPLALIPGCFVRLRMFDPAWQAKNKIKRLVCIDLDTVITGPLDPLFDRPEPFVILQGANASNPCPVNGSLMMLRAGAHPEVWSDFTLDAARATPFYERPDDQGWIAHKVPNAAGWKCGHESGVYAFCKPGWPVGDALPIDARMVTFPGWRDPAKFTHLPWIQKHWCI